MSSSLMTAMTAKPRIFTIMDVARYTEQTSMQIRHAIVTGKIVPSARTVSGKILFTEDEVDRYAKNEKIEITP